MSLTDQIYQDLKTAMKAGDSAKVSVLRMLRSAVSYQQIEKGSELNDDEVIQVIGKEIKKRRESIVAFVGKRDDLAEKEQQEMNMLQTYMPEAVSEEKIKQIIDEVIASSDPETQFGLIMKQVMAKLKGEIVDGKQVGELIRAKLS